MRTHSLLPREGKMDENPSGAVSLVNYVVLKILVNSNPVGLVTPRTVASGASACQQLILEHVCPGQTLDR